MFMIRRIHDDILPVNKKALQQVKLILKQQFPDLRSIDVDKIPAMLSNPLKHRFRSILYVAEDGRGQVKGFALLSYEPELKFCFLDYISASVQLEGSGIGGVLYEWIRTEAQDLDVTGMFYECLPDDPNLCRDRKWIRQNRQRLKFYERYGARPITNTAYETPLTLNDDCPPYLVFDGLELGKKLSARNVRKIVRAILERKYGDRCPPSYVDMVVGSFQDDPVRLRDPRYIRGKDGQQLSERKRTNKIALVVNDRHEIHHVRERGYVESPVRIHAILKELDQTKLFARINPKRFPQRMITDVHDKAFVKYFKNMSLSLEGDISIYPYVFPIRNTARPPEVLAVRAGYYCIDTFTPLNRNAYLAARRGVDCTLTAAQALLEGYHLSYALVRPPGHHAEQRSFGGFCYFNNAAVAAHYLSKYGRIAILDIDHHHGNGQQQIFYERDDVLTVSIHGHPRFAYPYFSGFDDEKGSGPGNGFNRNYPLPETITPRQYIQTCEKALKHISVFDPAYLIVCFGLDTARGDPTGTWSLRANDFEKVGMLIGRTKMPLLVVQEGGYNTRSIGINARHFFIGLYENMFTYELNSTAIQSQKKKSRV
ncbi:MAG TPA: histone deacetylase family protein [Deltaproteobacteria bacterium]|nr:histone deacetylase family protein [Deltaproteobacteria bacterium]